ncbi:hypothetical protein [Amycolatopsis sp. EV170708-02-1]|uniref:hypothetical protein n=1 Tax=Amycolatopsis sp. EV170708-02-1 TaxID=2919322 RepID=UPI001F0CBE51|nr:hypothetical protein [Amycolatopsis sp. EV170708-02-1]UMP06345.1 hypothetical protein MJQ72_16685 [Amycolatopsis sp. EV170708-02-1]
MIVARDVVEALSVHGVVGWYRIAVGRSVLSGLVCPPMIVWRYLEPSAAVRRGISQCVQEFSGTLEWVGGFEHRNWTLMPVKVRDAFAKADPTYVNVMSDLAAADQNFCLAANAELVSLLDSIKTIES